MLKFWHGGFRTVPLLCFPRFPMAAFQVPVVSFPCSLLSSAVQNVREKYSRKMRTPRTSADEHRRVCVFLLSNSAGCLTFPSFNLL